jgi:hypothetical protein
MITRILERALFGKIVERHPHGERHVRMFIGRSKMDSPARCRYDMVHGSVVGHVRYGLLIESEDGERGFVDSSYISDGPGEAWPEVGRRLRCVVLGYTREGRLRVAATPTYVDVMASTGDSVAAWEQWRSLSR